LLIVLLSTLIGNHTRIKAAQILGVILGFMGTALLVATKDDHHVVMPYRIFGLAAAFACALIWSSYSVLNRRFRDVPSQAMVGVCGIVALLGWGTHCLIDSVTVVHFMLSQLLAMFALGIGPVGLAFLAWDYGTKRGDIRLLGTISYAAPVLSTVSLVILGYSTATLNLAVACVLVVGGASIATTTTRTHGQEFAQ
jgi:drug/metabolite transporter (DMT)-like permease